MVSQSRPLIDKYFRDQLTGQTHRKTDKFTSTNVQSASPTTTIFSHVPNVQIISVLRVQNWWLNKNLL